MILRRIGYDFVADSVRDFGEPESGSCRRGSHLSQSTEEGRREKSTLPAKADKYYFDELGLSDFGVSVLPDEPDFFSEAVVSDFEDLSVFLSGFDDSDLVEELLDTDPVFL
jgi:hypothetical protein